MRQQRKMPAARAHELRAESKSSASKLVMPQPRPSNVSTEFGVPSSPAWQASRGEYSPPPTGPAWQAQGRPQQAVPPQVAMQTPAWVQPALSGMPNVPA